MPSPIPSGTIGRTDQGVDISASPGAPIIDPVSGVSRMVGVLQNWYQGQPFGWFRVLTGPQKGKYWYGAEQVDFSVHPGQTVQGGQRIGSYAQSGTGTEFGYATLGGQTLARATSGYTEGQATPAGQSFLSNVIRPRGISGGARGGTGGTTSLAQLWINNGGPAGQARTASAVAMAESSGNSQAINHNSNGSTDYGLWQINSVHGYDPQRLLSDPNYNAQCAVAVWKSSGWGAWTTYTSGAYLRYLGAVSPQVPTGPGITRPGGAGSSADSGAAVDAQFASYDASLGEGGRTAPNTGGFVSLGSWFSQHWAWAWGQTQQDFAPITGTVDAIGSTLDFLKWISWIFHPRNILRAVEFLAGISLMFVGLNLVLGHAGGGQGPVSTVADSPVGKTARVVAERTPAGRVVRERRAYREGRSHARQDAQTKRRQAAYRAGKAGTKRPGSRTSRRQRRQEAKDIPF